MDTFRQQGVSLIESLIAVLVVSFGVLGIARFQGTLFSGQALAQQRTHAQLFGREKLDEMASVAKPAAFGDGSDEGKALGAAFLRRWSTRSASAGESEALVEVSWQDSRAQTHRVTLASVLAPDVAQNESRLLSAAGISQGAPNGSEGSAASPWLWFPTAGGNGEGETSPPTSPPTTPPIPAEPQTTTFRISGSMAFTDGTKPLASVRATSGASCTMNSDFSFFCTVPMGWSGSLIAQTHASNKRVSPASCTYASVARDYDDCRFVVSKK